MKPGMVAYDIGGHIGFMTLVLSKIVGATGSVFAFAPFIGAVLALAMGDRPVSAWVGAGGVRLRTGVRRSGHAGSPAAVEIPFRTGPHAGFARRCVSRSGLRPPRHQPPRSLPNASPLATTMPSRAMR